jgi:hypothetical protein
MKKLLGILVLGLLWCNVTLAEEFYIACTVGMVEDKSSKKIRTAGGDEKEFGFQYFKFDNTNSEITIHEQIGNKKPSKVGSIIIDYKGKEVVEFEIKNNDSVDTYKLMTSDLSDREAWENFKFEGTVYLKSESSTFDYDFKSTICLAPLKKGKVLQPPKDKKEYKKWIKRGY